MLRVQWSNRPCLHTQVGGEPGEAPVPAADPQGRRIGHGNALVPIGRCLPEVAHTPWRVPLGAGQEVRGG